MEEILPANGNGLAWGVPAWSGEVAIGKQVQNVKLTNFADNNDDTMRAIKAVEGEAEKVVPDEIEFSVKANWKSGTEFKSETLTINQFEVTVLSEELPVGTEITFTELELPEVEGVGWARSLGALTQLVSPD